MQLRYSLRNLLLFVTVASVVVFPYARRVYEQNGAVQHLRNCGFVVTYDELNPTFKHYCGDGILLDILTQPRSVVAPIVSQNCATDAQGNACIIGHTKVDLSDFIKFQSLRGVHVLGLSKTNFDDEHFNNLTNAKELRQLFLAGTQVTDKSMKTLGMLSELNELVLVNTKITDRSIPELSKLKNLHVIYLKGTSISDLGIAELKRANPSLQIDRLIPTANIDIEQFEDTESK